MRLRLPGPCSPPPPPPAPSNPGNARQRTQRGREGPEGLGGAGATAASRSSPAGGLDRIWLGLRQRNKGGCRRLYLVGGLGRGRRGAALSPVGDLGGREERNLGPDPETGSPTRPSTRREVTSLFWMEDRVFLGWGEVEGVGWGGEAGGGGQGILGTPGSPQLPFPGNLPRPRWGSPTWGHGECEYTSPSSHGPRLTTRSPLSVTEGKQPVK